MKPIKLNERQHSLLRRIAESREPVTSEESDLTSTVYALRNRGLVTADRHAGRWTAEITSPGPLLPEPWPRPG